jgi:hypothetical protein
VGQFDMAARKVARATPGRSVRKVDDVGARRTVFCKRRMLRVASEARQAISVPPKALTRISEEVARPVTPLKS